MGGLRTVKKLLWLIECFETILLKVGLDICITVFPRNTDGQPGDMHNRQAITPSRLLESLLDYDLWPVRFELGLLHIFELTLEIDLCPRIDYLYPYESSRHLSNPVPSRARL